MQETMISHPRLTVSRKTGSEGPCHDPYAYEEYHVTTPKGKTVLHSGLGTWLKHNGIEVKPAKHMTHDQFERWLITEHFVELVGLTVQQIERIYRRLNSRCHQCGGKEFITVSGYPGETFEQCVHCSHIQGGSFDESAVM